MLGRLLDLIRQNRPLRVALGLAVVGVIFYFLASSLVSGWGTLQEEEVRLNATGLVVSALPLALAIVVISVPWILLLRHFAPKAPVRKSSTFVAFMYSWLGRYVPGRLPFFLGKFYLATAIGYPKRVLIPVITYEALIHILVAGSAGGFLVLLATGIEVQRYFLLVALIFALALALVLAFPRLLAPFLRLSAQLVQRDSSETVPPLPRGQMLRISLVYLLALVLNGLGLHLVISSMTSYSLTDLPLSIGAIGVAGSLGMLSFFAPAGLGVREGTLVVILSVTLSVEMAALVAIAMRIIATAVDLLLVGAVSVYDLAWGDRLIGVVLGAPVTVRDPSS